MKEMIFKVIFMFIEMKLYNEYIDGQQDGIYHLYALKSDAVIGEEFTNLKYGQNVTDLYPQLDRDNINDSPYSTKTHAANFPIGDVFTSDLKNSITREAADTLLTKLNNNLTVDSVSTLSAGLQTVIFTRDHGLGGLVKGTVTDAGTVYDSGGTGTYYNVKILTDGEGGTWNGATAKVVVLVEQFNQLILCLLVLDIPQELIILTQVQLDLVEDLEQDLKLLLLRS
jgi:hypothetical protein